MDKKLSMFTVITLCLACLSAIIGLFYEGTTIIQRVTSVHDVEVDLYGKGAYAYMSVLRASTYIATDIIILIIVVFVTLMLLIDKKDHTMKRYILTSSFMFILYYSISLSFGSPLYHFFLIYIALFFMSSITFFQHIKRILQQDIHANILRIKFKKTSYFLLIAACSSLIWLSMLIPAMIHDDYSLVVDINTTEPTFVLDIGYIFPLFLFTGLALLQGKKIGYQLTPVLLIFYVLVGLLVISQTIVQNQLGVEMTIQELIILVISFATLGLISGLVNYRFLKNTYSNKELLI